jgi:hypothetical protein
MASELQSWAAGERAEIAADLRGSEAGAKLYSLSGDDITAMKVRQLKEGAYIRV